MKSLIQIKQTTNTSKLKYLQKFKGKDGGGKYLKFEKKMLSH